MSFPDLVLAVSGGWVPDVPTINSPLFRIRSNAAPPNAGATAKQQMTRAVNANMLNLLIIFLLFKNVGYKIRFRVFVFLGK
jgi:hypothetical protein